jgi:hypothetical protein
MVRSRWSIPEWINAPFTSFNNVFIHYSHSSVTTWTRLNWINWLRRKECKSSLSLYTLTLLIAGLCFAWTFVTTCSGSNKQTECQSILGWQASADVSRVACFVTTWTRSNRINWLRLRRIERKIITLAFHSHSVFPAGLCFAWTFVTTCSGSTHSSLRSVTYLFIILTRSH